MDYILTSASVNPIEPDTLPGYCRIRAGLLESFNRGQIAAENVTRSDNSTTLFTIVACLGCGEILRSRLSVEGVDWTNSSIRRTRFYSTGVTG